MDRYHRACYPSGAGAVRRWLYDSRSGETTQLSPAIERDGGWPLLVAARDKDCREARAALIAELRIYQHRLPRKAVHVGDGQPDARLRRGSKRST